MMTVKFNDRHWSRSLMDRPGLLLLLTGVFFVPLTVVHALDGFFWFDDEGTLMAGFWSLRDGLRMYDDRLFKCCQSVLRTARRSVGGFGCNGSPSSQRRTS